MSGAVRSLTIEIKSASAMLIVNRSRSQTRLHRSLYAS